jgi:class 3 adenylate cyclase
MEDLPASVAERLQGLIYGERAIAYLKVDAQLALIGAGGHLETYGLAALRLGEPVAEQAFFLEGLLPLVETPYVVPSVEMSTGCVVDLYFLADTDTVWVVLLDVTVDRNAAQRMQQKAYEMVLLQEHEAQLNRQLEAANAALLATQGELEASRDALVRAHDQVQRLHAVAERARNNLSRYFSPNIVDILAAQDEALGAVRRQTVAVLFVDIVGFTRMAEAMPPEAVVTMLRQFHERMTAQIFACGGTVEKYIGDEIFAVFGVPDVSDDDAANALICADRILEALDRWNAERTRDGETPLAIGIGLNYGPAVLGDVGSEHSMSFTVIGDTVNTASRLQGLTRTLKTPLVVGGSLVDAIHTGHSETAAALVSQLQDQGEQPLRGRAGEVRVWTR